MKQRQWLALILSLMLICALVPASAQTAACDHHFVQIDDYPSTCTEYGFTTYMCDKCGYMYEKNNPPLGHNWYWYKTSATCTEYGTDYYRCSRCGEEQTERRGPLGHDYGERQVDIPATCTESGRDVRICSRDKTHIWYFDVEPLGHDWGEWEVVEPATTTSPGLEQRVCKRDPSHVEFRDIPQLEGGEEDLPVADINLSVSWPVGPYHVGQEVNVNWKVENTGNVPLTYRDCDGDATWPTLPETLEPGQSFAWHVPHTITIEQYNDGFYISPESGEKCDTPFETSHIVFYANVDYVYDPGYGNLWDCFDEESAIEALEQGVEGPSLFLTGSMDPQKMEFNVNETVNFHLKLTNNGSETLDFCGNLYSVAFGTPSADTRGTLAPGEFFEFDYSYTFSPELAGALIPFEWTGYGYRIGGIPGSDGLPDDTNPSLVWSNKIAGRLQVKDGPALFLSVHQTENFKSEYEFDDNPVFQSDVTNTGNVTLTHIRIIFWIENNPEKDVWPKDDPETLAPGEFTYVYGWNHVINEEDMSEPGLIYHWRAYGFEEGTYSPPADLNAPGNPEGIVWSNECTALVPLARKSTDTPLLTLANQDGSGAGKGLGDWVTTQLTLKNEGETLLNIRAIVYAAPAEYGATLANFKSDEFSNRIEGTVYWVDESDTFEAAIQVLPLDVSKGSVDRKIRLIGNIPGNDDPPYVYSNFVEIHIPLDTDPVPPPDDDKEARLDLYVTCPDPEPFWFGFDGYTDPIRYDALIVNTGNVPVEVTEMAVEAENDPSVMDLTHLGVTLLPGDSRNLHFTYKYEETQVVNGNELHISYTAGGDSPVGPVQSNTVHLQHQVGDPPPWTPEPTTIYVIKMATGSSENLGGYVEGETVVYEVAITNTSDTLIPSLTVSDDHCLNQDAIIQDLEPYETRYVPFQYTVTEEDVKKGYILNTATVTWTCPVTGNDQKEESTCVVDTTAITDKGQYGVDLMKAYINAPLKGPYFEEGETVTFYVYVENTSTAELYDVNVTDPLTGDAVYYAVMTPGQIDDLYFTYTVSAADAALGSVTNTAYITGHDAGNKEYAMTASVTIPTGIPPVPGMPSLYIFKEETSTPKDSRGYQEGEIIDYKITVTNDGDVDLFSIDVFDIDPDGQFVLLATIPIMHPNDSQSFLFSWKVADWNVWDGWVWNSSFANYNTDTLYSIPVGSNTVESETWAPTPDPPDPPIPPEPGKAESCIFELTGSGDHEIWYELTLCPAHGKTRDEAAELIAAGAWDKICALWLDEIHEMYDSLSRRTASKDRAKVAADRGALDHIAANMEDGKAKAEWLMLQCSELCYLNGNAPAERPDSRIFGRIQTVPTLLVAGSSSGCGLTVQQDGTRKVQIIENLCKDHAEGEAAVGTMLDNSLNRAQIGNVFTRAQRLWRSGLDEATSAAWMAAAGTEGGQAAVVSSRHAFDGWFAARTELLNVLYPDRPETVAEILSNILRRQVLLMCEK